MTPLRLFATLTAAALALALTAPAASLAAPGPLVLSSTGSGHSAGAAVDAAGNLHVVWADTAAGKLEYRYCLVRSGESTCAATDPASPGDSHSWTFDDTYSSSERGYVLLQAPSTVVLAISRSHAGSASGEYTITSTDGGATFGSPHFATSVFDGDITDEFSNGSVALGVGGVPNLLGVYDGYTFNAFDGTSQGDSPFQPIGGTIGGLQSMVLDAGGRPLLVVRRGFPAEIAWSRYSGATFTVGALTNRSNWSTAADVPIPSDEGDPGEPSLSSGGRGVFLTVQGNEHIFHFDSDTGTWSAPAVSPVPAQRVAEDAAGRLYGYGNDFGDGSVLCYSRTDPSGTNPSPLASLPVTMNPTYSRFALPTDGSDSGAWLVGGSDDGKVQAVPLASATADPSCNGSSSSGGSGDVPHIYLRGSFRVNADGTFSFTFVCPAGASRCTGTVTVTVTASGQLAAVAAAKRSRITIARAGIHVAAGRTAQVRVHLNRTGRRLLARHRKVHATISVAGQAGAGGAVHSRRAIVLKRAAAVHG